MLRFFLRTGLRRGVLGGSRAWLAVGAAAGALRLLGRLRRPQPEVMFRDELQPGTVLLIAHARKREPEVRVNPSD